MPEWEVQPVTLGFLLREMRRDIIGAGTIRLTRPEMIEHAYNLIIKLDMEKLEDA